MVLKALGPHQYCYSDNDYDPDRVPLLKNAVQPPPYVVGDPVYGSKNATWNIRINDKVKNVLKTSIGNVSLSKVYVIPSNHVYVFLFPFVLPAVFSFALCLHVRFTCTIIGS